MSEATADRGTLVGPDAARAELESALDAVERGTGTVMLAHGDAGIGKSRLVHEVLGERPLTVLWGTAYPLDHELAYAPIVAALTAHLDRPSRRCWAVVGACSTSAPVRLRTPGGWRASTPTSS